MSSLNETKEQLLVILSRFPFPLDKGDKLRAFHQIKELSKKYSITLVALSSHCVPNESLKKLQPYCESIEVVRLTAWSKLFHLTKCFFSNQPFQVGYFYSIKGQRLIKQLIQVNKFKHIYCQLIRTSEYVKNIHHITKTIDYMDALSMGIKRRIEEQPFYAKWLFRMEAKRLVAYERNIFDYFENKTIISEQDRKLIGHPDASKINCVPNGIDERFFEDVEHTNAYDFVFVGNMNYPPNIKAVHSIANTILPHFKASKLLISGATPHASVVYLAKNNANIDITGWVDDIRLSYVSGQLFVAPMHIGTGMQNKLLEAMALGIPCVTTPLASNAIEAIHGEHIMVANSDKEFIKCIQRLRSNPEMAKEIGRNASNFVLKKYSWKKSVSLLIESIEQTKEFQ
jgi:sugar transferase (PEP-CTERM/EpsH1 system associated)